MAEMEIWLQAAGERIQLPIVPSEIETTFETGNTTQKIHTFGEVLIFGKRGSRQIHVESWWPDPKNNYGFLACKTDLKPYKFVTKINSWKYEIIKLTITGTNIKGLPCAYTTFTHSEVDASGDIKFAIDFVEYRMPTFTKYKKAVEQLKEVEMVKKPATIRPCKPLQEVYVVQKGDNLWSIARKMTGSDKNHTAIYEANKDVIEAAARKYGRANSNNGWWIYPGTELVIPI